MQTSRPTARAERWSVPSKSRCTRSEEAPRGALTQSQLGLERSVGASEEKRGDEEGKGRRGRRHELGKSLALEGGQRKAGRLEQLSQQQRGGQRGGRRVRSAGPGDPAKVCVIIPPKKATSSFETSFPQLGGSSAPGAGVGWRGHRAFRHPAPGLRQGLRICEVRLLPRWLVRGRRT